MSILEVTVELEVTDIDALATTEKVLSAPQAHVMSVNGGTTAPGSIGFCVMDNQDRAAGGYHPSPKGTDFNKIRIVWTQCRVRCQVRLDIGINILGLGTCKFVELSCKIHHHGLVRAN